MAKRKRERAIEERRTLKRQRKQEAAAARRAEAATNPESIETEPKPEDAE